MTGGGRISSRVWLRLMIIPVVLFASSCRVPTNDRPHEISTEDVPAGLLATPTTTSSTVPAVPKDETVYFLRTTENRTTLFPVVRQYEVGAQINTILDDLIENPPDSDGLERPSEFGLTTSLPGSVELITATVNSVTGILTVNVRGIFGDTGLQGPAQVQAAAQIVFTATEDPAIRGVLFRSDGRPVAAPVGGDDLDVDQPATRSDYRSLAS